MQKWAESVKTVQDERIKLAVLEPTGDGVVFVFVEFFVAAYTY